MIDLIIRIFTQRFTKYNHLRLHDVADFFHDGNNS